MSDRTLLDRPAVARRLGLTVEQFYRNTARLMAEGFPAPAFGRGAGARWDPKAIDCWLDAKITAARPDPVQVAIEDQWAPILDGRARTVATAAVRGAA